MNRCMAIAFGILIFVTPALCDFFALLSNVDDALDQEPTERDSQSIAPNPIQRAGDDVAAGRPRRSESTTPASWSCSRWQPLPA
jgi:hypothetical protein